MIGEMRDQETAEIAVQAAMTGHLVFSTLHTNDAVSAVPRLLDLRIPDYLVAATLEGVLAQRLVRRVCPDCRVPYTPTRDAVTAVAGQPLDTLSLARGAGCDGCRGTGFRGRIGLFELFVASDDIRDAIAARAPRARLRSLAVETGLVPLRADGWAKVQAGLTTVEEVMRVVQD
jgi:type II secretory ATPase GspE/PulE/Tfp pilus assembly ATPase PilB-like protein